MGIFRFKEFNIINEKSSMKVNTDSILMGSSITILNSDVHILDIGTGTGCIALMLTQRYKLLEEQQNKLDRQVQDVLQKNADDDVFVEGIDVDRASAEEAGMNFKKSPWKENLRAECVSIFQYEPNHKYSLIVSNPPYYDTTLQAPSFRRNSSRHESVDISSSGHLKSMSYRDVMDFAIKYLEEKGRLSLIMPANREEEILLYADTIGLFPYRIFRIKTVPRKPYCRVIMEFVRKVDFVKEECSCLNGNKEIKTSIEELHIRNEEGKYTNEYISLTKSFYLNLN